MVHRLSEQYSTYNTVLKRYASASKSVWPTAVLLLDGMTVKHVTAHFVLQSKNILLIVNVSSSHCLSVPRSAFTLREICRNSRRGPGPKRRTYGTGEQQSAVCAEILGAAVLPRKRRSPWKRKMLLLYIYHLASILEEVHAVGTFFAHPVCCWHATGATIHSLGPSPVCLTCSRWLTPLGLRL